MRPPWSRPRARRVRSSWQEHLAHGGLGSIAARVLAARYPVPIGFVNLGDTYAESGDPRALLERYGLTAGAIGQQARTVVLRKSV